VTEILQKQYCFTGKKPKWVQQRFKKLMAFVKKNTNKPEGHQPWKKYKFQLSQDNFFFVRLAGILEKVQWIQEESTKARQEDVAAQK
jgi:hypothetical protein